MTININTEKQLQEMLKRFLMDYLEVHEDEIDEIQLIDFAQKEAKNISFNTPVSGQFAAFKELTKYLIGSDEYKIVEETWEKQAANFC